MVILLLSVFATSAALFASALHWNALTKRVPEPSATAVFRLRRAKTEAEALDVVRPLDEGHPMRVLVEVALRAPSRPRAIADINEVLGDVGGELAQGSLVPSAAARIAGFSSVLLAIVELARTLPRGGPAYGTIGAVVAVGAVGVVGCALVGRRVDKVGKARREAYDAVSLQLERLVAGRFGGGGES